jgi:ribonucleotide reductase beta subunit family protein with ferritin-like domain
MTAFESSSKSTTTIHGKEHDADEMLLQKNESRYVLFPIVHHDIFEMYKKAESTFWRADEIDLGKDMSDWEKLNDNERHFIKNVIGFFAGSDGIVMENLAQRFLREIEIPEVRNFYSYQIYNEAVHSLTYSLLIDTYVRDPDEKHKILNSIQTIPCVSKKAQWAQHWIENKEVSFATRLVGFAIVEGIFFSGSFCAIYWLKKRGLMPGLTFSNELISKDEGLHCEFATLLYSKIKNRISQSQIYEMIDSAVKIEKEFVCESIPVHLLGMNADSMCTYIEFVANRLMTQLGYEKYYKAENPFEWMELISLRPKSNFFEVRVGEYVKSNVNEKSDVYEVTDDF